MQIAPSLRKFLTEQGIDYQLVSSAGATAGDGKKIAEPAAHARADFFGDEQGLLMVVYPASRELDFSSLRRSMGTQLKPFSDADTLRDIFDDCEADSLPAVAEPYGLRAIVDESLGELDTVYLDSGRPGWALRMSGDDFHLLHVNARHGGTLSQPARAEKKNPSLGERRAWFKQRLRDVHALPPMPDMAVQLLKLRNNPKANVNELVDIIQLDPSLCAQLMRHAQSALYGYRGGIISVRDVITRVMGFDMVLSIAMGTALGRRLNMQQGGPLGTRNFWRHSVYSAALAEQLARAMPAQTRPPPGLAYLAGFLHNFGYLVLGHVFADEFAALNTAAAQRPDIPIRQLETQVLGVRHTELGAWLFKHWNLPEELIIAAGAHHDPNYRGAHAIYNQLVLVATRLLRSADIGDAETDEVPEHIYAQLGLEEDQAHMLLSALMEGRDDLNLMATQLAA